MTEQDYQERYEPAHEERVTLLQVQAAVDVAVAEAVEGPYMERADVLALVSALLPAVIAPLADDDPFRPTLEDADAWRVLYLAVDGRTWTWHLAPAQVPLFAGVEEVGLDDERARYDGHTTAEKYEGIRAFVARVAPAMARRAA